MSVWDALILLILYLYPIWSLPVCDAVPSHRVSVEANGLMGRLALLSDSGGLFQVNGVCLGVEFKALEQKQ